MNAPVVARLLLRLKLRAAKNGADAATQAAIDKALADPNFVDQMISSAADEAGVKMEAGGILPPGGLAQLLQWLLANLPQIIALIMSLFGG